MKLGVRRQNQVGPYSAASFLLKKPSLEEAKVKDLSSKASGIAFKAATEAASFAEISSAVALASSVSFASIKELTHVIKTSQKLLCSITAIKFAKKAAEAAEEAAEAAEEAAEVAKKSEEEAKNKALIKWYEGFLKKEKKDSLVNEYNGIQPCRLVTDVHYKRDSRTDGLQEHIKAAKEEREIELQRQSKEQREKKTRKK